MFLENLQQLPSDKICEVSWTICRYQQGGQMVYIYLVWIVFSFLFSQLCASDSFFSNVNSLKEALVSKNPETGNTRPVWLGSNWVKLVFQGQEMKSDEKRRCISCGASPAVHHLRCITCGASPAVHHLQCITFHDASLIHAPSTYLTSLNHIIFKNIAHLGSLKLLCLCLEVGRGCHKQEIYVQ